MLMTQSGGNNGVLIVGKLQKKKNGSEWMGRNGDVYMYEHCGKDNVLG